MLLYGLSLAVFLGSTCGMPLGMDEAMRDLATADIEVTNFYSALENKDFDQLPELYEKLNEARPTLQAALARLQRTDPGRGLQALKRLLNIQLDTVLFRLNGLLPSTNGGGPEQSQQSQYAITDNSVSEDDDYKPERMPKSIRGVMYGKELGTNLGKKLGKKYEKKSDKKYDTKKDHTKDPTHYF